MATSPSALSGFNGSSKFAASLQQSFTRTLGIASLPLDSLYATQTKLKDRQTALQTLDGRFAALQSSLNLVQNAVTSGVLNSSISNGAIVSASLAPEATAGTYSIEVSGLGSFSSALSVAGSTVVTDPTTHGLTSARTFNLTAGGITTAITAASSSLQDVAAAINLQAGTQAQAAIVNVGSSSSPDYRLSLRANKLGADPIALTDATATNLVSSSTAGTLATFAVDGSSQVTSDSRTITLAPGVTVTLLSVSPAGSPVAVTIHHDPAGLTSAFSNFAQSYNAAVDTIGKSHGPNAGVLQGDSLLSTLSGVLRHVGAYTGGTPETALSAFGIGVDKNGHLSVDSAALATAANTNFASFLNVVGGINSGGFLKSASDLLDSVERASSGYLTSSEGGVSTQLTSLENRITDQQAKISRLQQNLILQLAKADTAISKLESTVSYVNGLFYSITGNNHGTGNSGQ